MKFALAAPRRMEWTRTLRPPRSMPLAGPAAALGALWAERSNLVGGIDYLFGKRTKNNGKSPFSMGNLTIFKGIDQQLRRKMVV